MCNITGNSFQQLRCKLTKCLVEKVIKPLERIRREHFRREGMQNEDVIVVLIAKDDHNGALLLPGEHWWMRNRPEKMIIREVSKIADINRELSNIAGQGNRIKGLWIKAHGQPNGMALGTNGRIENSGNRSSSVIPVHIRHLFPALNQPIEKGTAHATHLKDGLAKLEPGAPIILISCSAGHRTGAINNKPVAQCIAEAAPGHVVIAAKEVLCGPFIFAETIENGALGARFARPKHTAQSGLQGFLTNLFYRLAFVLSLGRHGERIDSLFLK